VGGRQGRTGLHKRKPDLPDQGVLAGGRSSA
jgi:hypothetical protein